MTRSTLIRCGALAAIAGGSLRAAASFAPIIIGSDLWRESLYVVVDTCLTAGLLGFYSQRRKGLGPWATPGLAAALVGIATIRVNRLISAADLYAVGALATACGVMILTIRAWIVTEIRGWIPAAFTCSTLVGVIGSVVQGATALFVWSGVLFGIAFSGLGVEMWTAASRLQATRAATARPHVHIE
jgi:hypothetical protein